MQNLEKQFKNSLDSKTPWDELRKRSWHKYDQKGLPNKSWENWKFTPLTRIHDSEFELSSAHLTAKEMPTDQAEVTLYVTNGKLAGHSPIPDGMQAMSFEDAVNTGDLKLEEWENLKNDSNPFYELGNAFLETGLFLKVNKDLGEKHLIKIVYDNDGEQMSMCHPQVFLKLAEGASTGFFEEFKCGPGKRWTNAITKIFVEAGANLRHYKCSSTSEGNWHLDQTLVDVEKNGNYDSLVFYVDEGLGRNEIVVNLKDEQAHARLNGVYLPKKNGHSDHYTLINHQSPKSYSNQLYKGILEDESMAVFAGTVKVGKNAPGVDSTQLNKNLILSKKARIETQPQLLISTDDVKCAHGATIGQINEDEMFYLQTRGIPRQKAFEMLASAFAEQVLLSIKDDRVHDYLHTKILVNSVDQPEK